MSSAKEKEPNKAALALFAGVSIVIGTVLMVAACVASEQGMQFGRPPVFSAGLVFFAGGLVMATFLAPYGRAMGFLQHSLVLVVIGAMAFAALYALLHEVLGDSAPSTNVILVAVTMTVILGQVVRGIISTSRKRSVENAEPRVVVERRIRPARRRRRDPESPDSGGAGVDAP